VDTARREADEMLAKARAELQRDAADARARLDTEAGELAAAAASRILGRRA